jgi:hypothetical protein
VIGCIIQHYKRGLVQVCKELVSEPRDVVATIENFVVVPLVVTLLLWTTSSDKNAARTTKRFPQHVQITTNRG